MTAEMPGALLDEQPPAGIPMIRAIAMPADVNANGDIFGGWLMSQMDMAAGNLASRVSHGRCVTVAVDAMSFLRPVKVGDEVSVHCSVLSEGRTSIKINVEAWRRARITDNEFRVTQAVFTFVAIDEQGKPRPVRGTFGEGAPRAAAHPSREANSSGA
jgi:acyl-CoA thioesterase YciA